MSFLSPDSCQKKSVDLAPHPIVVLCCKYKTRRSLRDMHDTINLDMNYTLKRTLICEVATITDCQPELDALNPEQAYHPNAIRTGIPSESAN